MRVLLAAIVAGLAREILDTLPSNDEQAGMWVSGLAWGFLIFIILLMVTTMAWAKTHGVAV